MAAITVEIKTRTKGGKTCVDLPGTRSVDDESEVVFMLVGSGWPKKPKIVVEALGPTPFRAKKLSEDGYVLVAKVVKGRANRDYGIEVSVPGGHPMCNVTRGPKMIIKKTG